jgi:hypothetical protein
MNRHEQDLFENMLEVLRSIEVRLGKIEAQLKKHEPKEEPKKQLLND